MVICWRWLRDHLHPLHSSSGLLYTWGHNVAGQLGHGHTFPVVEPKRVLGLGMGVKIRQVRPGVAWLLARCSARAELLICPLAIGVLRRLPHRCGLRGGFLVHVGQRSVREAGTWRHRDSPETKEVSQGRQNQQNMVGWVSAKALLFAFGAIGSQ